ncbi:uncharacterized protein [Panulirus ornatus]|uniref:uncharacterized protein n=1 Tax=Panulirus ornatus TaxID=150431 RepID=UPI003A84CE52
MSWVSFVLFAALLIGSVIAVEDVNSANEVLAEGEHVEGRSCTNCGGSTQQSGSYGTGSQVITSVLDKPSYSAFIPTGSFDPSVLLSGALGDPGGLGIGVFAIPILAVNIAILVLLAILLAHVKYLGYGDTGTGDSVYHYAPVPAYVGGGHSSYQSYDSSASGYSKRSAKDGRNLQSPSTFQFLTKMVADAIEKYGAVDEDEE